MKRMGLVATLQWVLLAVEVLILAGIVALLWMHRGLVSRQREVLRAVTQETQALGRSLAGETTAVLRELKPSLASVHGSLQALSQRMAFAVQAPPIPVDDLEAPPPEHPPLRALPEIPSAPYYSPATDTDPQVRLENLLNDSAFLQDLWPLLNGPADQEIARLHGYLSRNALTGIDLAPYPDLGTKGRNHWMFLIAQARGVTTEPKRFVVPRMFSRYDPAWHAHLFEIRGRKDPVENFIRGLHRCAALVGMGDLRGNVQSDLVQKKGVISLTVPEVVS